ncbi:Formyl-coenzyme a transferase [Globisporangium polare]
MVLHDLIHERGLTDWRVVAFSSADSTLSAAAAAIYGRANAGRFDESRALRKRKPFARNGESPPVDEDAEASTTGCCFLVLATSSNGGQLSVQRLVGMEQAATANAPEGMPRCERTFLCLTDTANVSYYHLGCGHAPPPVITTAAVGIEQWRRF